MSNELDVQLRVSECIPDFGGNCQLDSALTPRRPNVVSHRGHEVTVHVRILSLPPETMAITLRAHIVEYGPDRLGTEEFTFRAGRLFGTNPGETFSAPSTLPADFSIRVSELGSDHLGQGPYEVIVNVEPSGGEPLTPPAEGEAGAAPATTDETIAHEHPTTSGTTTDEHPTTTVTTAEDTSNGIHILQDRTFFLRFTTL